MTVEQIANDIVAREGGFIDDPDDRGGATKFGVTIHTMRNLGLDLDRDGDVDVADVRLLTRAQATNIFMKHYFKQPHIDHLPAALQPVVFDMYVNAGSNAVKILQSVLREFGAIITVDGCLGPQSFEAAKIVQEKAKDFLVDAYAIARRNYYFNLADRRVASRKFARSRAGGKGGWIHRAEEFMQEKYRMTDAEFQMRVSKWA